MAFPATYNISYYRGDSYSFILNPKNSDGSNFNLTNYSGDFQVKATRNPDAPLLIAGNVDVDTPIVGSLTCSIDPETGENLDAGTYVYDVQIVNTNGTVYTLVTGNFVVTNDISRAE